MTNRIIASSISHLQRPGQQTALCYSIALFLIIMLAIIPFSPAQAKPRTDFPLLNINAGETNILDNTGHSQRYGLEYRFKSFAGPYGFRLIPSVGAAASNNNAYFIYTDLRHDFYMNDQWLLTPSFGIGLFRNGDNFNLGDNKEFRSGIELAYRFDNDYRAGLALFHISNGGLSSRNPGTEVLVFSVSIPIK